MYIEISRNSDETLTKQIYKGIKYKILEGSLTKNERLPSTRDLSKTLGVSRNVVAEAYEQLFIEGYVESKQGSGTFVVEIQYLENLALKPNKHAKKSHKESENIIDFKSGIPELTLFPKKLWGKIYNEICNTCPPETLGYHSSQGDIELRTTLVEYLYKVRGVCCSANQIVITTGAAQAFSLISRLLLREGDVVITEDPFNKDIFTNIYNTGASIFPVSVDENGMNTKELPENIEAKLIFLTPSHQFPLGGVLPIKRRIEIINYARLNNTYIIEDDYDSEFRFNGSPIASFQSLAPEKVIYIGTFSKILSPALRIGYIILPEELVDKFLKVKFEEDLHSPILEQLALKEFIQNKDLEKHIRKSKKLYHSRQKFIKKCLSNNLGDEIKIWGTSAGIHLVVEFKNIEFDKILLEKIKNRGVKVYPVEMHAKTKGKHTNKIIMGYGHLTYEQIEKGIEIIKEALHSYL